MFKCSGKVLPLDFSTERLFPRPLYSPMVQRAVNTPKERHDQEAIPTHARAGHHETFRWSARASVPTSQPGTHTPYLPGFSGASRERKLDLSRLPPPSASRSTTTPQDN